jgi:hypothetical protein
LEKNFLVQKSYFQRVKASIKKTLKKRQLKVLFNAIKSVVLHPQQQISSVEEWQVIKGLG